jgi:hypothetical protein
LIVISTEQLGDCPIAGQAPLAQAEVVWDAIKSATAPTAHRPHVSIQLVMSFLSLLVVNRRTGPHDQHEPSTPNSRLRWIAVYPIAARPQT